MATEDITLSLSVEMKADKFRRSYEKSFHDMEKSAKRAQKEGQGAIGGFLSKMSDGFNKVPKLVKKAEKSLKLYNAQLLVSRKAYKQEESLFKEKSKLLRQQTRDFEKLSEAEKATHQVALDESKKAVEAYKKRTEAAQKSFESIQRKAEDLSDKVNDLKFEFSGNELTKAALEAGKELAEPLSALLHKDVEGAGKSFAKLAGRGLKAAGGHLGGKLSKVGGSLSAKGAALQAKGGGPEAAMGAALKGLGAIAGKMGPVISTVSKLGPLLGTLGGSIFGLVKMFVDAEAMVKEFNKDILASAGTAQWFSGSMGNVEEGLSKMDDSLRNIRESAYNASNNLDWGISADTHKEVLSSLQAEGVQLTALEQQFGQLNQKSAAFSKDFGSVTQAAVAYSRSMGISLQEVTGFQAEMMTELGQSLGQTVDSFRMITRSAEDSGIASNKFYAMIRGVSADLSLYNTRLEDAVKLLGKLGKVMSPRNAQKFMQSAMNAYKGASFQDKVKSSLLAGPAKTAKLVAEDIASKNSSIAKAIADAGGGTVQDVKKALEAGPAGKDAVRDMIKKVAESGDKSKVGTLKEAVSSLNAEKRMAKGGLVGNARALSKVSVVAAAEHKYAETTRFGSDEGHLGSIAGDSLAGLDDETRQLYQNMAEQIAEQREELVKRGKMSAQEAKDASWTKIYDTMDQATKDTADGKDAQEEANKRMGTRVQSIMEQLQVFIDWMMHTFYEAIIGIWETLTGLPGASSSSKTKMEAQKTKDPAILAAVKDNKDWRDQNKALKQTDAFKEVEKLSKMAKGEAGASKRAEAEDVDREAYGATGPEAARAKAKSDALRKEADALDQKQALVQKTLEDRYGEGDIDSDFGGDRAKARESALGGMMPTDLVKLLGDTAKVGGPSALTKEEQSAAVGDGVAKALPNTEEAGKALTTNSTAYTHDTHVEDAIKATFGGTAAPETQTGVMETGVEAQEATLGTLGEIENVLKNKGIKLNKSFMENQMAKMIEESTLNSLRVALFEFAMLAFSDKVKGWKDDFAEGGVSDPKSAMKFAGEYAGKHEDEYGIKANAAGGMVSSVAGGLAKISPAPGEGLTSIGKGERIVPAGGGGGGGGQVRVELSLKGDLKQFVEATAQNVVVEHMAAMKNRLDPWLELLLSVRLTPTVLGWMLLVLQGTSMGLRLVGAPSRWRSRSPVHSTAPKLFFRMLL
jgi:polyhydroxyalkanoate synthesis regulator phasin